MEKPKRLDKYWTIFPDYTTTIDWKVWNGDEKDEARFLLGLVFSTKFEAEQALCSWPYRRKKGEVRYVE